MQCAFIQSGQLVMHPEITPDQCTAQGVGYLVVSDASDVAAQAVTADQIGYSFAWGFGSVVLFWSLGYAVGVAKQLISKV